MKFVSCDAENISLCGQSTYAREGKEQTIVNGLGSKNLDATKRQAEASRCKFIEAPWFPCTQRSK
jgi:hypothetical protein